MSFTLNTKIINARQGDEEADSEIKSRLKTALYQCLDTHANKQAVVDSGSLRENPIPLHASESQQELSKQEKPSEMPRLPTSALVNRLGRQFLDRNSAWQDKIYFYRIVSGLMRQALRDFVGISSSEGRQPISASDGYYTFKRWDSCIKSLLKKDKSLVLVLEMYYMGGMSYEGIASALSLSIADVDKKLRFARAWVCRELVAERV